MAVDSVRPRQLTQAEQLKQRLYADNVLLLQPRKFVSYQDFCMNLLNYASAERAIRQTAITTHNMNDMISDLPEGLREQYSELVNLSRYISEGLECAGGNLVRWKRCMEESFLERLCNRFSGERRQQQKEMREGVIRNIVGFAPYAAAHVRFRQEIEDFKELMQEMGWSYMDSEEVPPPDSDPLEYEKVIPIVSEWEIMGAIQNYARQLGVAAYGKDLEFMTMIGGELRRN